MSSLFEHSGESIVAYCDGGSRGNPGPAGFGVYKPRLATNNTRTRPRYIYVNDLHPGDDDVTGVQNPLLAEIARIVGAA